jgi:hypothetical protein
LQSLLAERAAVDAEVAGLIGMAPLKRYLAELRAKVTSRLPPIACWLPPDCPLIAPISMLRAKVEFVERGGDPRLLEACLNLVLTGNPGAGKTTAARLLFKALRAYGLLKRPVFVERNALELKGTHIGWTCPQVKEMVQAALGGCLFLDEAYALAGSSRNGEARGDAFSDEAIRTLLTEVESNRTSLCVVLAGYRDAMDGLMRADPGLVRRFPKTLLLEDYTPAELASIARQTAQTRFGLSFAVGLEAALAVHIEAQHADEIAQHNASLAVALVEAAINRLALRVVGTPRPFEDASPPVSPASVSATSMAAAASSSCSTRAVTLPRRDSVADSLADGASVSSSSGGTATSVDPTVLMPSDFLIHSRAHRPPPVSSKLEMPPDQGAPLSAGLSRF